jgi:hypothetical protein
MANTGREPGDDTEPVMRAALSRVYPNDNLTAPFGTRYRFRLSEERNSFRIERSDGAMLLTYVASEDATRDYVEELERQAERGRKASALGDSSILCRSGWHQKWLSDGVKAFFRSLGGRIGDQVAFRVGSMPVDAECPMVRGLGPQAKPWRCSACGEEVPKAQ